MTIQQSVQGEVVVLRVTGLGTYAFPEGVTVRIDGIVASVLAVTPSFPGVFDLAVQVPAGARSATRISVSIEVAGVESNLAALAVGAADPLPAERARLQGSREEGYDDEKGDSTAHAGPLLLYTHRRRDPSNSTGGFSHPYGRIVRNEA